MNTSNAVSYQYELAYNNKRKLGIKTFAYRVQLLKKEKHLRVENGQPESMLACRVTARIYTLKL